MRLDLDVLRTLLEQCKPGLKDRILLALPKGLRERLAEPGPRRKSQSDEMRKMRARAELSLAFRDLDFSLPVETVQ